VKVRTALAVGAGVATAAHALDRFGRRRYALGEGELATAGRTVPADVVHHEVVVSDGGRIHVVERGSGPAVVLVHGICADAAVWAPQLRTLSTDHRVVALAQRGHGRSVAGAEGYRLDRLAADLVEVCAALDVEAATLAGHSMGAMVVQLAAIDRAAALHRHVARLVLVATSPGPVLRSALGGVLVAGAARSLVAAGRRGRGALPRPVSVWGARALFGADPSPADVALIAGMLDAMSPDALAGLLPHLASFDVHRRLHQVALPTSVVAGARDVVAPPSTARALAAGIDGADLSVLPGCGHMVMLEREDELCRILA
jgi:pimeloyl-ACP methyl ester carboxylesterase